MCKKVGSNQIQTAKRVNLVKFLESEYPHLIVYDPKAGRYLHSMHDSCVISEIGFFRFSNGQKGDQIQFLEDFCGMTFQEAVITLYNYSGGNYCAILPETVETYDTAKSFEIPVATDGKYKNVWAYLVYKRGIPGETVEKLFAEKKLYQAKKYNNCVFLSDTCKFAEVVGTTDIKFKHIVPGSDSDGYWCTSDNNADTIYICESAIDAISLNLLMNKYFPEKAGCYASMGGLKDQAYLSLKEKYSKVIFAVDNDVRAKEHLEKYPDVPKITPPELKGVKDWNDVLRYCNDEEVIKSSLTDIYYDRSLPY